MLIQALYGNKPFGTAWLMPQAASVATAVRVKSVGGHGHKTTTSGAPTRAGKSKEGVLQGVLEDQGGDWDWRWAG